MNAINRWRRQVAAHHAQSVRAMGDSPQPQDFWRDRAPAFRADPRRADDPSLARLLAMVQPSDTVIDVGGGGGRYALPLALKCRRVTVVEPSPGMVQVLQNETQQHGIGNISVVNASWEDAQVEPADVVLCAHVLYGIEDVEPFVRKLHRSAQRLVAVHMFMEAPQTHLAPLWRVVRGERRINLPAMPDFMNVAWEMGIYPNLEILDLGGPRTLSDKEEWRTELCSRLYIEPGSTLEERLEQAMTRGLVQVDGGYAVKGTSPRRLGIAWWNKG
ncbi:MAG: class I SAM-dependent methyltransferase [Chloroflexi bacterium]|nr:class I SAM-dependent methyltransferase [Chloroflexota bacterium]